MSRFNLLHHPVLLTGKQKLRRQKASSSGLPQPGLSKVFPLNHHCPHFLVPLSCFTKITSEHHLKHRNRPGDQGTRFICQKGLSQHAKKPWSLKQFCPPLSPVHSWASTNLPPHVIFWASSSLRTVSGTQSNTKDLPWCGLAVSFKPIFYTPPHTPSPLSKWNTLLFTKDDSTQISLVFL